MLGGVRLVLVRHAEAAPGEPDELRPLTPDGREAARELGEQLAADDVRPDAVLTSPLLRARETAPSSAARSRHRSSRTSGSRPARPPTRSVPAGQRARRRRSSSSGTSPTAAGSPPSSAAAPSRVPGRRHLSSSSSRTEPAVASVSVRDLRKSYGDLEAVRGISFEIERGEVFGLLGPNGAGKTTTVEILEGYRKRDGGEVEVLGVDPASAGGDWRERIGVVLQSSAMYETLTVAESLRLFAGYYASPRPVDEVVELIGLTEKRDALVRRLSGGQRRRLDLGLGLVGDPELIFLDEPTTGFDPHARRQAWETLRSLRELGKTILLTTHYLDEAEQLADRVAVLARGARSSPSARRPS